MVGGLEYLADLPEKVPTTANVEKYIKIVEEKSILRSLIKTSNELITLGYDETQGLPLLHCIIFYLLIVLLTFLSWIIILVYLILLMHLLLYLVQMGES